MQGNLLLHIQSLEFPFFFIPCHLHASFYLIYSFVILFLAMLGLGCCVGFSLIRGVGATLQLWCMGFPSQWLLLLPSAGSGRTGAAHRLAGSSTDSGAVADGPSCLSACGSFPDQGSNPCPLFRQVDSLPLSHQGSPRPCYCHVLVLPGIQVCCYNLNWLFQVLVQLTLMKTKLTLSNSFRVDANSALW